jgi:Flp pilus assembly protein TadD
MSRTEVRRRRRRRLALIGGVVALLVGAVAWRYATVSDTEPTDPVADAQREQGLAAFAAGDDEQTLEVLLTYVQNHPGDVEVLRALALTHERLAEDDRDQLLAAVNRLRQWSNADPQNREARRKLLGLLIEYPAGVETELVTLSDRVLREHPEDPTALRARVIGYGRMQRTADALDAADAYLAQQPLDPEMLGRQLDLLKQQGEPPATLLQLTEDLRTQHPDDPRAILAEAYARTLSDDRDAALEWLARATESPTPSTAFAEQVVSLYDRLGESPAALRYLETVLATAKGVLPREELIRRRFEAGRVREAHELFLALPDPSLSMKTLDALALLQMDRPAQASEAIAMVGEHPGRGGPAVARLLERASDPDDGPAAVLEADRAARDAAVSDPYLDLIVAEAYLQSGQPAQAQTRYESALAARPNWAAPCLELARLNLQQQDFIDASRFAAATLQRQPNNLEAAIVLAQAQAADPAGLDAGQQQRVLALIDRVQEARPGEARTLALRVDLLAAAGRRADAAAAVEEAMNQPLNEAALLALIETAERHHLEARAALIEAYTERFGQSLKITMMRADRLLRAGEPDEALSLYDQARPREASVEWAVNRALLLERMGRDEATAAWAEVADAAPDRAEVQQAALRSHAAWQDRGLVQRGIDRLKRLHGEDDAMWRLEQARFWLTSERPAERASQVLAVLEPLPETDDTLRMRASARRLQGDPARATTLLKQVLKTNPANVDARYELAGLLLHTGERERAIEAARAAAAQPDLSDDQLRRTAGLLAKLSQLRPAIANLETLERRDAALADDLFALAQLYRRAQRVTEAIDLIDRFLAEPTPASISFAADLLAQQGESERAMQVLDRLDDLDLPANQAQAIRAAHLAVHGEGGDAQQAFQDLIEQQPDSAVAWRNLVAYHLRAGRVDAGLEAAGRATGRGVQDEGLATLARQANRLRRLGGRAGVPALAITMLLDDAHRRAATRTLEQIERHTQPAPLAEALQQLAQQHPDFEDLQLLAATSLLRAGRINQGVDAAQAAFERFTDSPRAARLAAESWAAVGQWRQALLAAEAWAQRTPGDRAAADTLVARSHRQLGRSDAALRRLEPYRSRIESEPRGLPELTREFALALAADADLQPARQLLEPRLGDGVSWRMTMLEAAVRSVAETQEAGEWIEAVEAAVSGGSTTENAAVAQAWWTLGQRDSYPPFIDRGRELTRQLVQRPDADAELWFFLGTVHETAGQFPDAEHAYRRALRMDDAAINARNNLAMVLTLQGKATDEALRLIDEALSRLPNEPNLYDTKAFVLLNAGRYDAAEAAIQQAIELNPANPAWQVRLNEIRSARPASTSDAGG